MPAVQPLSAASILIEARFALQQLATMAWCMLPSVTAMSSFCYTAAKIQLYGQCQLPPLLLAAFVIQSFGLLSRVNACTAAGSLHTMVLGPATLSADVHLSGAPDILLQETSRDVPQSFVVTDSVFITAGVTAGLLA